MIFRFIYIFFLPISLAKNESARKIWVILNQKTRPWYAIRNGNFFFAYLDWFLFAYRWFWARKSFCILLEIVENSWELLNCWLLLSLFMVNTEVFTSLRDVIKYSNIETHFFFFLKVIGKYLITSRKLYIVHRCLMVFCAFWWKFWMSKVTRSNICFMGFEPRDVFGCNFFTRAKFFIKKM